MEAMLASMLGAGDGAAAAAAGGSSVAGARKDGATPADTDEAGQPSMEDLMALLQMYEKNPQDAPPELGVRIPKSGFPSSRFPTLHSSASKDRWVNTEITALVNSSAVP
jgi:hypothetical protein